MHSVARGTEPDGLAGIRAKYTAAWIDYYSCRRGRRPTDAHWRRFRLHLKEGFRGLCGYCEVLCSGEVDHVRPKSRHPELVYDWYNWVFSCHECNLSKGSKWPSQGYVNPCPETVSDRPERFFWFDVHGGEIIPADGLAGGELRKANNTIVGIGLNSIVQLKRRLFLVGVLNEIAGAYSGDVGREICRKYASEGSPYSSLVLAWLYAGDG